MTCGYNIIQKGRSDQYLITFVFYTVFHFTEEFYSSSIVSRTVRVSVARCYIHFHF